MLFLRRVTRRSIARELDYSRTADICHFCCCRLFQARETDRPESLRHGTDGAIQNACQMLSPAVFPTARGSIAPPLRAWYTYPDVIAVSLSAAADFLQNIRFTFLYAYDVTNAASEIFANFSYKHFFIPTREISERLLLTISWLQQQKNVLFAKTVIWNIEDENLSLVKERGKREKWINIDNNSYK